MLLSISLEVTVPEDVNREALQRIGEAFSPAGSEGMEDADAVEAAFNDPDAICALSSLGIEWTAIRTGTITHVSSSVDSRQRVGEHEG